LQNLDRNFPNLVAPPTDGSAKYFVHCEEHPVLYQRSKKALKSMHNWRRYPSSNWYEIDEKSGSKFGALLWRHLTPERKTATYVHNNNPF